MRQERRGAGWAQPQATYKRHLSFLQRQKKKRSYEPLMRGSHRQGEIEMERNMATRDEKRKQKEVYLQVHKRSSCVVVVEKWVTCVEASGICSDWSGSRRLSRG